MMQNKQQNQTKNRFPPGNPILVGIIKDKETNKDFSMVQDHSNGKMVHDIQASGLRVFVMVMEFTLQWQAKNILVNGRMVSVTAKESGLNQMDK